MSTTRAQLRRCQGELFHVILQYARVTVCTVAVKPTLPGQDQRSLWIRDVDAEVRVGSTQPNHASQMPANPAITFITILSKT
jgi:hypothetical protein